MTWNMCPILWDLSSDLLRYHDRYLATACVIRCYSTQTIRAFLKPTNYRKFQVKRSNGDSHILWPAWSAAMVRTGTTIFALVLSAVHRSIADSGQIIFFSKSIFGWFRYNLQYPNDSSVFSSVLEHVCCQQQLRIIAAMSGMKFPSLISWNPTL